jgi:pyrimidine operon attenuation protein/uracil phosphoribosyltransferase
VLIDRGGRELPICARYCAYTLGEALPAHQELVLTRGAAGALSLEINDRANA